jgi:hypothetical protein
MTTIWVARIMLSTFSGIWEEYQIPLRYPKQRYTFLSVEKHDEIIALAEEKGILMPD